jgi:hypothetical protein
MLQLCYSFLWFAVAGALPFDVLLTSGSLLSQHQCPLLCCASASASTRQIPHICSLSFVYF